MKFLSLGVMGAIREIEFCRMIKEIYSPHLEYYQLGDMVSDCAKVNYKCNYQPGLVMCPRTRVNLPYESCKDLIDVFKRLTYAEKL